MNKQGGKPCLKTLAVGISVQTHMMISVVRTGIGSWNSTTLTSIHVQTKKRGITCMVSNATFNNISAISWQSVLQVEEIAVPGENH